MIDTIIWQNRVEAQYPSLTLNTLIYPLRDFQQTVEHKFEEVSRPRDSGSFNFDMYPGSRTVTLEGQILGDTAQDFMTNRRAFARAFAPKQRNFQYDHQGWLDVLFTGAPEVVRLWCSPTGLPEMPITANSPLIQDFQVQLIAPNPAWYSWFETTFSTTDHSGNPQFTVSGDFYTWPILRFTGPQTNPSATWSGSGAFGSIFFNNNVILNAGQVLTVDVANRSISGPLFTEYQNITSVRWEPLPSGTVTLDYSNSTRSAGHELEVVYTPAYWF